MRHWHPNGAAMVSVATVLTQRASEERP